MRVAAIAAGRRLCSFAVESDAPGSRYVPNVVTGRLRLPTEPIGAFTLTLTNLVVGSAIRIEIASTGTLVELRDADATTEVFSVPVYASGSANNDLRIKVRKGSAAPFYKPYETQATATLGSQSVFIAQTPD